MIVFHQKHRVIIILTFATAFLGFIASILMLYFISSLAKQRFINYESQVVLVFTEEAAKILQIEMENVEGQLNLMSLMSEIQSLDPAICNQKIIDISQLNNNLLNDMGRINSNQIVYCSSNTQSIGVSDQGSPSSDEAFKTRTLTLGRASFSRSLQTYVVSMHAPVFDKNQKFQGTVGGAIHLNRFRDQFLGKVSAYHEGRLAVLDDNGDIIYHFQPEIIGKNLFNDDTLIKQYINNEVREFYLETLKNDSGVSRLSDGAIRAYNKANIFPGRSWKILSIIPKQHVDSNITTTFGRGSDSIFSYLLYGSTAIGIINIVLIIRFLTTHQIKINESVSKN